MIKQLSTLSLLAACLPALVACDTGEQPEPSTTAKTYEISNHHKRGCGTREVDDGEKQQVQKALDGAKPGGGGPGGGGGGAPPANTGANAGTWRIGVQLARPCPKT
jgi:hypothetical protein